MYAVFSAIVFSVQFIIPYSIVASTFTTGSFSTSGTMIGISTSIVPPMRFVGLRPPPHPLQPVGAVRKWKPYRHSPTDSTSTNTTKKCGYSIFSLYILPCNDFRAIHLLISGQPHVLHHARLRIDEQRSVSILISIPIHIQTISPIPNQDCLNSSFAESR